VSKQKQKKNKDKQTTKEKDNLTGLLSDPKMTFLNVQNSIAIQQTQKKRTYTHWKRKVR